MACLSIIVRKMTPNKLNLCAGLARSPFVLTEHISSIYIYSTRDLTLVETGTKNDF